MLGSASNDTLDTIFPKINNEIAKLFEDRNILLTQGGLITFTGTQVEFTETLYLVLNQKISGAVPQIISLGSSTQLFTNSGDMLIATVDRTAGTAVLSVVTSGNPLPAVDSSNQEVFLIAVRYDALDGTQRLYWRTGMAMNAGQTIRLGSSGSGNGSGLGDDVITTQFRASFTDEFDEGPTAALSAVNSTLTKATYSAAKALYQISYDATKLGSATGVNVSVASAPSFTVQVGDMFIRNNEAKRITGVVSQTTYQVESAFSSNFVSQAVTVSQAVHSKDVYNTALDGSPISAAFTDAFSEILVDYEDTSTVGDAIFDINVAPVVGFSASVDNTTWTNTETRPTSPLTEIQTTLFSTAGTSLYVRLFANKTSGSGTVNVLKYKAYMQKVPTDSSGGVLNSAYAFTNGVGTPVNCSLSVVGGKTRVTLTWQYPVGINVGTPFGSIDVYLNGQLIPRYINATLTPNASFTEVSSTAIDLDSNYSAVNVSVEILQRAAIVDQSSQNSTYIAQNTASISAINSNISLLPTIQRFTSGSGTYYPTYAFIVAGTANVTAGATYTNNSVTFTAITTSSASGSVYFIATGTPTSSGDLIKSSGTGDSVISFSSYKKPKYIMVKMAGGGGGGAGGNNNTAGNTVGGTGTATTFGASLLTANPGTGGSGSAGGTGGAGGTVTVNSPAISVVALTGGGGGASSYSPGGVSQSHGGGAGGNNAFGGGGFAANWSTGGVVAGGAASSNSGGGGGGGTTITNGNTYGGAGGGAGGYIHALILSPATSYAYSIGGGGVGGTPVGANASSGGAGASGIVIVEEYYV
jgi:hypothetical protein